MDTKQDSNYMFTCKVCKYWRLKAAAGHDQWSECCYPAIEEMGFGLKDVKDVTREDWTKLEHLVKDILHLRVTYLGFKIPNFEFPFRYESLWITGCDGFEEDKSHSYTFK